MTGNDRTEAESDVIVELKRLGKQVGETLDAAWKSAERRRAQEELEAGARAFVGECESALRRAGSARPADAAAKARRSAVEALRWLSAELESLAERFTPADTGTDSAESARRDARD